MPNLKANKNPATTAVKLMSAANVRKSIDTNTRMIAVGLVGLHADMVQCMLHAEKHGDITLAQYLMQQVRDNCKGVVVAGIAQWFAKFSPIKLTSQDGVVNAELLKEGDKGYKPFNSAEAETTPAMESREVTDRANRPIVKPTISYFKGRIAGFAKQVDNYNEKASDNEKLSADDAALIKTWLNAVTEFGNKVSVLNEDGKPVARVPAAVAAAQKPRRGRPPADGLRSQSRTGTNG